MIKTQMYLPPIFERLNWLRAEWFRNIDQRQMGFVKNYGGMMLWMSLRGYLEDFVRWEIK